MNTLFDDNGALFSKDRMYRYCLWRIWDPVLPRVMFIGLNPSTANEVSDDPTIRRVKRFAIDWGYGGVYMMNLFAYVTAYPEKLRKCENPIGNNDFWLQRISGKCQKVIFAWGSFEEARERAGSVVKMFPNGEALIINSDGSPRHPLYVPSNTIPVSYETTHH